MNKLYSLPASFDASFAPPRLNAVDAAGVVPSAPVAGVADAEDGFAPPKGLLPPNEPPPDGAGVVPVVPVVPAVLEVAAAVAP